MATIYGKEESCKITEMQNELSTNGRNEVLHRLNVVRKKYRNVACVRTKLSMK